MENLKFKIGEKVRFTNEEWHNKYGECKFLGYVFPYGDKGVELLDSNNRIIRSYEFNLESFEPKQEKLRDKNLNIYEVITYLENAPVDTAAEMNIDGHKTELRLEDGDLLCFEDTSIFDVDTHVKILNATFDIIHEEEKWIRVKSVSEAIEKFIKDKKDLRFTNGTIVNTIVYKYHDNIFETISVYPLEDIINFKWYYKK